MVISSPYQYDDRFIFWYNDKWRLVNATERELYYMVWGMSIQSLHGMPTQSSKTLKALKISEKHWLVIPSIVTLLCLWLRNCVTSE